MTIVSNYPKGTNMATRLIVGCGYVGMRVAEAWLKRGDRVYAITRSASRAGDLRRAGIEPIIWDWLGSGAPNGVLTKSAERVPSELATVLVAVSHSPQEGVPHTESHTRGLNHLMSLLQSMGWSDHETIATKWIYLSTTGVFAQSSPGDWVDEDSAVLPERPGSIAAWAGEQWIAERISQDKRVVLRPVGIYGPGRVPRWESLRDQVPLQVDPDSFLNLIHVDDLAGSIVAVSTAEMRSSLYCVSDGHPVRRQDYYSFVSKLGNWPEPVFEPREPAGNGRVALRSDGNKRVRNSRIQSELAVVLTFPSYREGLRSLLDQRKNSG